MFHGFSFALVVLIFLFFLIVFFKTKKYIRKKEISGGGLIYGGLIFIFFTCIVCYLFLARELRTGVVGWHYLSLLAYGVLGTVAHVFVHAHRRAYGKNKATTIMYGFTYICWQVFQIIVMVVTAVVDIIISLIAADWKETNKRINAREKTEAYFRETGIDKPSNYETGLNIEYREFLEKTGVEDNSDARKIFSEEYFKAVYK